MCKVQKTIVKRPCLLHTLTSCYGGAYPPGLGPSIFKLFKGSRLRRGSCWEELKRIICPAPAVNDLPKYSPAVR